MVTQAQAVVLCAVLTWLMIFTSSALRTRLWTPAGLRLAFGNRENLPEPSSLAGRADRAARNMLENMVLFLALMLAADLSAHRTTQVQAGASIFFWARLAYWPLYLAGIPYLRTVAWTVSIAGLAMVAVAAVV